MHALVGPAAAILATLLLFHAAVPAAAHPGETHPDSEASGSEALFELEGGNPPGASSELGFMEREGEYLPMDAQFQNSHGKTVTLGELTRQGTRPLVLNMQYYECPNLCGQILIDQAQSFSRISRVAGEDYQLVTISIAPDETAALAAEVKNRTLTMLESEFPAGGWSFLTGEKANIDKVAEAVGFRYRKKGDRYDHPMGLVFISPEGKITRYVHGLEYLPAVVNLSIMEASSGTVQPAVAKVLKLCFSYNPDSNTIAFRAKRVTGVVTVTFAGVFGLFLLRRSLLRRRKYRELERKTEENG